MGYPSEGEGAVKPKKFDSINVVPFIDIMLVLLVIVLTTATFVAKGIIPVSLPKSTSGVKSKEKKDLTITITQEGKIFFEKEEISKQNVIAELHKYESGLAIRINCDREAKFDTFVYLLDQLKIQKFENLGIITKHE